MIVITVLGLAGACGFAWWNTRQQLLAARRYAETLTNACHSRITAEATIAAQAAQRAQADVARVTELATMQAITATNAYTDARIEHLAAQLQELPSPPWLLRRFNVVLSTDSGAEARQLFEQVRPRAGSDGVVQLFDGTEQRGIKP